MYNEYVDVNNMYMYYADFSWNFSWNCNAVYIAHRHIVRLK